VPKFDPSTVTNVPPPAEPLLGEMLLTAGVGPDEIFSEKFVDTTSMLESTTFAPNENDPAVVGLPLITPAELNATPAGNCPLFFAQE
jgi:hypothetical protein